MSAETEHEVDESGEDEPERSPAPVEVVAAPAVLRDLLEPLLAVAHEARLHFDEDAVRVCLVDPANVAMVDVELDPGAFHAYDATGTTIGFNLERLDDVLKLATGDVSLSYTPETRRLSVRFDGAEYDAATIDQTAIRAESEVPDPDLPASFRTEGRHLERARKVVGLTAGGDDPIYLESRPEEESVGVSSQGDTDTVDVALDEEDLSQAHLPERVKSAVSMGYFTDLVTPIGADADVDVELGEEMPVFWEYRFADGFGSVRNAIAPRIDTSR